MTPLQLPFQYVGIPKRCFALIIDELVCEVFVFVFLGQQPKEVSPRLLAYLGLKFVVLWWAYFALMESSTARGTLGKMALGIETIDHDGKQISLKQASWRYLGKYLWNLIRIAMLVIAGEKNASEFVIVGLRVSIVVLCLGYLMAAFTPEKQALHDRLAGTYVVEAGERSRSIPQKVIFQIVAIAIISRFLFHFVPAAPFV